MEYETLSKFDHRVIEELRELCNNVIPIRGAKIYSALAIKKKIIAREHNILKSHTFQYLYSKNPHSIYLHSETNTIRKALYQVKPETLLKATLYTVRIIESGKLALARPCSGCQSAIDAFGITKHIYTGYDSVIINTPDRDKVLKAV